MKVYCDVDSKNKGWLVIQRRMNGSEDFNRSWADYKAGFGNVKGDFWLGNEFIYQLTKEKPRELRIDIEAFDGLKRYALYSAFSILSESRKYNLYVAGYNGDAGDSLERDHNNHNNQPFSTFDVDNDRSSTTCCACKYEGDISDEQSSSSKKGTDDDVDDDITEVLPIDREESDDDDALPVFL
ncbi:fibroleukin-like [Dreissena polymorpha]|uniref:fibroleukin-like n=1 Tax=Dreissena polymorpha TaxID=45954 RepID=UPI0022640451|nr:fibroleukin-like [Dreissena polymorpha]